MSHFLFLFQANFLSVYVHLYLLSSTIVFKYKTMFVSFLAILFIYFRFLFLFLFRCRPIFFFFLISKDVHKLFAWLTTSNKLWEVLQLPKPVWFAPCIAKKLAKIKNSIPLRPLIWLLIIYVHQKFSFTQFLLANKENSCLELLSFLVCTFIASFPSFVVLFL